MQQTSIVGSIVTALILAGAGLVFLMLTLQRVDVYLRLKAYDDCARVYQYEKTVPEENVKVIQTLDDLYRECLREKGI